MHVVHRHTFRQNIYTHKIKISSLVMLAELPGPYGWAAVVTAEPCGWVLDLEVLLRTGWKMGMCVFFLTGLLHGISHALLSALPPLACGLFRGWYEIQPPPSPESLPPDTVKIRESPCGPLRLLPVQPSWSGPSALFSGGCAQPG